MLDNTILSQTARPSNGQAAPDSAQCSRSNNLIALAAAELLIFHCENRKAKCHPRRRFYWQRQLNVAWRSLARQQRAGER